MRGPQRVDCSISANKTMFVTRKFLTRKLSTKVLQKIHQQKFSSAGEINVLNSGLPDVHIPNISIQDVVFENISKWSDKTAVVSVC